jgi:hypothetical protein
MFLHLLKTILFGEKAQYWRHRLPGKPFARTKVVLLIGVEEGHEQVWILHLCTILLLNCKENIFLLC